MRGLVEYLRLDHKATILDFGCGNGLGVKDLLDIGFDAWGADIAKTWPDSDERLKLITTQPYRLPFDNDSFDAIISEQVMEHVFEYDMVFAEIARVLKPNGVSAHRFPGPGSLIEGHTNIPLAFMCRHKPWLWLWTFAGRRRKGEQIIASAAYRASIELMKSAHYPRKSTLVEAALRHGLTASFHDTEEFLWRGGGGSIFSAAKKLRIERALAVALSPLMQRFMMLKHQSFSATRDYSATH
jgi:SAM-dependent methyltransferase